LKKRKKQPRKLAAMGGDERKRQPENKMDSGFQHTPKWRGKQDPPVYASWATYTKKDSPLYE